jgi:hypothetical protein
MLQLLAWIIGLINSFAMNTSYLGEQTYFWWQGMIFAVLLYPAVWLLGFIFPRLTLNFASGAMVGGAAASVFALFTLNFAFLPGALLTWLSGYLTAKGQSIRLGG